MLVRCTSCNKPVFVSSSIVASGDARVVCKACNTELIVTSKGDVRSASGGAPAAAPTAAPPAPAIGAPAAPQLPPAALPTSTPVAPEVAIKAISPTPAVPETAPIAIGSAPWNQLTDPSTSHPAASSDVSVAPEAPVEATAISMSPFATTAGDPTTSGSPFGASAAPTAAPPQPEITRPPGVTTPLAWRKSASPDVAYQQPVTQSGLGAPFQPVGSTAEAAASLSDMPTHVGPAPNLDIPSEAQAVPAPLPELGATLPVPPVTFAGDAAPDQLQQLEPADRRETSRMERVGDAAFPPEAAPTPGPVGDLAAILPPAEVAPSDAVTHVGPAPGPTDMLDSMGDTMPGLSAPTEPPAVGAGPPAPILLGGSAPIERAVLAPTPEALPEIATGEGGEPEILEDADAWPLDTAEPIPAGEPLGLPLEQPASAADASIDAAIGGGSPSSFRPPTTVIEPGGVGRRLRRAAKYGVVAVVVVVGAGAGAWALGFIQVPGLKSPFASRSAGTTIAVRPSPRVEDPVKTPIPSEPTAVEPGPTEPTPAPATETPPTETPTTETAIDEGTGDAGTTAEGIEEPAKDKSGKNKKDKKKPAKKPTTKPAKEPKASTKSSAASAKTPPKAVPTPAPTPAPTKAAGGAETAEQHFQAATGYMKEKKVPLAIDELNKALAANPKDGKSYRLLGMAYTMAGREKSAIEAFEKFLKYEPGHKDAPKVKAIIDDFYRRNPK
jgi:hypothetical protein